jgi:predicted nucleic acid-binding Zn ribbon protein
MSDDSRTTRERMILYALIFALIFIGFAIAGTGPSEPGFVGVV